MRHKNFAVFLCLTLLPAEAGNAADLNCYVPMKDWQPRSMAKAAAKERGWKVRRIKIDDGCYEVTGWDKQGNKFEARIDPATLEIVKMEIENSQQAEDRETKEDN
ncbi:MAG: PepSY domain-containing protein [Rhodobacterales bacterium]